MKIIVSDRLSSFRYDARKHEKLLFAGLRQGLRLPHECATGTCGSCRARLTRGEIEPGWPQAPGRAYLKPQRDEFLLCQAYAKSDCEIRVPGELKRADLKPAHYSATISEVQPLTAGVYRFELNLDQPIRYLAGQFMVIQAPDISGYRAYSMTNYANPTQRLEFVIKQLPGGRFSHWIAGADGASVASFGPLGSACFRPQEAKNIICIAGGSGVAGMLAILAHGCQTDYFVDHTGQLFFGVRTHQDLFFLPQFKDFAEQFPDTLQVTVAFSEQAELTPPRNLPPNLVFTTGFPHEAARLSGLSGDQSIAYIAGPPPMVDAALRDLMLECGFSATQIRYDKFA